MFKFVKNFLMLMMLATITVSTLPVSILNDARKGQAIQFYYQEFFLVFIPWLCKLIFTKVLPYFAALALGIGLLCALAWFLEYRWELFTRAGDAVLDTKVGRYLFGSTARRSVSLSVAVLIFVGLLIGVPLHHGKSGMSTQDQQALDRQIQLEKTDAK